MNRNLIANILFSIISALVFGGLMFVFYHFVDKMPIGRSASKAALAAMIFSILSSLTRRLLNRNKKS